MTKYYITETRPATMRWMFEVVAESEEEALRMVVDGEVDSVDFVTDENPCEGSEYSVDSEEAVED